MVRIELAMRSNSAARETHVGITIVIALWMSHVSVRGVAIITNATVAYDMSAGVLKLFPVA